MRKSDKQIYAPFLAVCTTPNTFHSYNRVVWRCSLLGFRPVDESVVADGVVVFMHCRLLVLTCMRRCRPVCLRLQDIDIKRSWPGCVIAEPYVLVRSLPYTRGQVRRLSDPGFSSRLFAVVFVLFG